MPTVDQSMRRQSSPLFLQLLAIYYLLQGLLLAALGFGWLILLDQDQALVMKQWLHVIHVDAENRYIHELLTNVLPVWDHQQLEELSLGSFVYAGIAFAQGGGLLFAQRWASFLTVVVIGSFIPWELYAIRKQVTPLRFTMLGLNGLIVWYLLAREWHAGGVKEIGHERKNCPGK